MVIWNTLSLIFLVIAVALAKKRKLGLHKFFIVLSLICSLVLVVIFIDLRLAGESVYDLSQSGTFFKSLLFVHIIAAVISTFYSLYVTYLGVNAEKNPIKHKKHAYKLIPIWVFSSVSGIALYFMA